jgi:hypothetical protein
MCAKSVPGGVAKNGGFLGPSNGSTGEEFRGRDGDDRNRDEDEPATGGEETTRSGLPSAGGRRMPA